MSEGVDPNPAENFASEDSRNTYAELADTTNTPERPKEPTIKMVWERDDDDPEDAQPTNLSLYVEGTDWIHTGFGGELVDYEDYKTIETGTVSVDRALEGTGLGEALVRALGKAAVDAGCDQIDASFYHPAGLKHFINVFGEERIHYFDAHSSHFKEVDYSFDEAVEIINQRRAGATSYGQVNFRKMSPIVGWVEIQGLDASNWPSAEVVDPADAPWNQED